MGQLDFYNFLLDCCPEEAFEQQVLSLSLFQRIIAHLKMQFYSGPEKIAMCEVLIQVLYLSKQEQVAKQWDAPRLLD
jgi:hypothetical protein